MVEDYKAHRINDGCAKAKMSRITHRLKTIFLMINQRKLNNGCKRHLMGFYTSSGDFLETLFLGSPGKWGLIQFIMAHRNFSLKKQWQKKVDR
jgi:hypothetical protein